MGQIHCSYAIIATVYLYNYDFQQQYFVQVSDLLSYSLKDFSYILLAGLNVAMCNMYVCMYYTHLKNTQFYAFSYIYVCVIFVTDSIDMYVCMHTYMWISACVHSYVCICMPVSVCACVYVCVCVCACVYMCMSVCV